MKRELELVLIGQALKTQLDSAGKILKAEILDPVKAWLLGMPARERRAGIEAAGIVKAYIQEDRASAGYDLEALRRDFSAAVAKGKVPPAAVAGLLSTQSLVISDADSVARAIGKNPAGYAIRIPGGGRPAMRLVTLDKGQFDGLQGALKTTVDLEKAIRDAALGLPQGFQIPNRAVIKA